MEPEIKLIKMRIHSGFLTFALALIWALPAQADVPSGLSDDDLLDATLAFGSSGYFVQQYEAHRHLYADNTPKSRLFNDYAGEMKAALPQEKLPFQWIASISGFHSTLLQTAPSGALLTDQTLSFKVGIDFWLGDQVDIGAAGGIQATPEEDFNQGVFHFWAEYILPLRKNPEAAKGSNGELAKEYYGRLNGVRQTTRIKESELYPQLRLGARLSFIRSDKGPDDLGRASPPLSSHVIVNESDSEGILEFFPSREFGVWGAFSHSGYDSDPNGILSNSQFGSRPPTGLALAELENFSDLMMAFPHYGLKGGVGIEISPDIKIRGALVYDGYNLLEYTSSVSFAAVVDFAIFSNIKLGVGGDLTTINGNSSRTGAVSLGCEI
jgi:hypothetical protein